MRNVVLVNLVVLSVALVTWMFVMLARLRSIAWIIRETSVISKAAAIPALNAVTPVLDKELARARRKERLLTMAVLRIEDKELVENIGILVAGHANAGTAARRQAMQTVRIVFLLVGTILRDAMRESDIIAYDVINDDYVLLLPDCPKQEAAAAAERMQQILPDRTMANSCAGFAEFPKDALTLDTLIAAARAALAAAPSGGRAPVEAAA